MTLHLIDSRRPGIEMHWIACRAGNAGVTLAERTDCGGTLHGFGDDILKGDVNYRLGRFELGASQSLVFGFVASWIAVFEGYDAVPTSEGVSRATTRTVVHTSLAVLGLDFILTALMFGEP